MVTALLGVVVIAVIVSGAFFSSTQEYRGGRNQLIEQRAFAVAEYGLNSEISNWDRARNLPGNMAVGAIDSSHVYVASSDTARVRITRLTDKSYWVVSEGSANIGSAKLESKRATSAYVRLAYPSIAPKGAITTAGDVSITGSAVVDGTNHDPAGWTQCAQLPGQTVPAVVASPAASVSYKAQNITSTPALLRDAAAVDSNTYVRYGTESWKSLVSNADITLPGGIYNSAVGLPDHLLRVEPKAQWQRIRTRCSAGEW
jgi:Tfp pilus assembly protein PilX